MTRLQLSSRALSATLMVVCTAVLVSACGGNGGSPSVVSPPAPPSPTPASN